MRCRVVILNNEIVPYRIPLFAALSSLEGIDLHILYSARRGWDRAWDLSGHVLPFPHTVLPGFFFRLPKPRYREWRTLYVNPTLLPHLLRLSPEVVIGYEYSLPALTALLYSRLRRCGYVAWSECTAHSDRGLTRGQRLTRRIIVPRASAYLGTSRAACANLQALGARPDRIYEAPQSHDVRLFRERVERARGQLRPRPPTLLYVGSLSDRKGVALLLEAFARVAGEMPQARLILAGSGPLRPQLESQASRGGYRDRVEFLGFVEPGSLPRVFADADVLALPSLEDTFGVVVVEAWTSGLPVVCSQYAGVCDYVTEGKDGFVVNPERTEEMAGKILALLRDPDLRGSFAAQGQALADRFDAHAVAERFRQAIAVAREAR
ncbi:MAG: glycosyltransferase [Anaerolineales bacterium]|jgi:glycosyltransferase involved in cell wall biosynthesis